MKQLNIFECETISTENNLTPRQYRLHDLLIYYSPTGKMKHKQILEHMDADYGYTQEREQYPNRAFNDLKSRRDLSDDLDIIVRHKTFHKVYVGGKYATSAEEAVDYLEREKNRLSSEWQKYHIQLRRAKQDNQMRMLLNERGYDTWESWVREE